MSSFKLILTDDVITSTDAYVTNTFTGTTGSLTSFVTSSTQVSSSTGVFFYEIYPSTTLTSSTDVQFTISYGNRYGSGSTSGYTTVPGYTPSRSVYGQYRSLRYGDENANFTFGTLESDEIYVINMDRSRYKERLEEGNWTLEFSDGTSTLKLTDDSAISGSTSVISNVGRIYNIISGSAGTATSATVNTTSGSYGMFLPDAGLYILNPKALRQPFISGGIDLEAISGANTGSIQSDNLFRKISSFTQRSEETLTSKYYFVRLKSSEFNYTTNPTLVNTAGTINSQALINNPVTYITTVGLYNDSGDLLAVAKTSKPIQKDFTKEVLLRVKLSY
jgi:hypothetical protein